MSSSAWAFQHLVIFLTSPRIPVYCIYINLTSDWKQKYNNNLGDNEETKYNMPSVFMGKARHGKCFSFEDNKKERELAQGMWKGIEKLKNEENSFKMSEKNILKKNIFCKAGISDYCSQKTLNLFYEIKHKRWYKIAGQKKK